MLTQKGVWMPKKKKHTSRMDGAGRLTWPNPVIEPVYLNNQLVMNPSAIADLMTMHHWTQADLAEYMGVHPVSVSRWIIGQNPPSPVNKAELDRLITYTNRLLEKYDGRIPPEERWRSPRLEAMRQAGKAIPEHLMRGAPAPEPEARPINLLAEYERKYKHLREDTNDAEGPEDTDKG